MTLKIGIVGLPNIGKSTLFNALTKSHAADAQNYPFCTINPNIGIVEIPDERVDKLAEISKSAKKIPTAIEFVDIAGLVQGASEGEGLGNKFLSHIREVDAIAQVVRDFVNPDIQHVSVNPSPADDIETIETELILADLQTLEKRSSDFEKKAKGGDKEARIAVGAITKIREVLEHGKLASSVEMDNEEEQKILHELHLLTTKPLLYAVNLSEEDLVKFDANEFKRKANLGANAKVIPISAKVESELVELEDEEAKIFLADLGLAESSLNRLIREAYEALALITFFTSGEKETRAWTVQRNSKAPVAAGKIHTDFERGFIRADVMSYENLVAAGSEANAREKGWIRSEGKEYVVKDGDVCVFKFNV
ncbi:redox-regulated ATPase YchF [Candidatus Gracilibacteria bacterium]|nr:redox-regulated ATPase YchF [Candidatus Gracilibacteria bacterium]MCF7856052.1 redox-regulated ATPase YchF [Candidatus Gracilibacteria bacterium]MCF7896393.1 redox-regulated ATPase YchF [Candidatus Gracilibacteria bacterium]